MNTLHIENYFYKFVLCLQSKLLLERLKTAFILYCCLLSLLLIQGCTAVATFPTVARAGDTVSVMIGGTEKARKSTISVILTDGGGQQWDLQLLGKVRSVFNLRADARAEGSHYSSYIDSYVSWSKGHEAVQTVLVVDIPVDALAGNAFLSVDPAVDDDSSGISAPYTINIEIIPGTGSSDNFLRRDAFSGSLPVDFSRLEPAPHAKISFGFADSVVIGAASLVVDFDETVVDPNNINLYVPESNVRGSYVSTGSFGDKQRMVYWHQDGQQVFIDVIAPQGIDQKYLMMYLLHPAGISGSAGFSITASTIYDVDGNEIVLLPTLKYFQ